MDTVSFRTLGGGAADDTDLGARTPERHGHHDLAGGYGAWGSHLGFGSYWSFHNLGDVTAFKKGPNQGRAFRHSF